MSRFFTPAWLLRHTALLVLTAAFLGLGWWQWNRANEGNMLSWGYTFQWPLFALFALGLWVREIRAELRRADPNSGFDEVEAEEPLSSPFTATPLNRTTGDDDTDAYNRYLSWLAANPNRRPSEYPG